MKSVFSAKTLRNAGCAALLALLAASSYAGRSHPQSPSVPVMIEMVSSQALASQTLQQTSERLEEKREEALALVHSVLEDPQADEAARKQALIKKTQIAGRMETEASIQALLAHMGFEETAVIMGEGTLSIVAPWQIAENEHNRVRMIDAAVSQSGLSAEAIKIILAKK